MTKRVKKIANEQMYNLEVEFQKVTFLIPKLNETQCFEYF